MEGSVTAGGRASSAGREVTEAEEAGLGRFLTSVGSRPPGGTFVPKHWGMLRVPPFRVAEHAGETSLRIMSL